MTPVAIQRSKGATACPVLNNICSNHAGDELGTVCDLSVDDLVDWTIARLSDSSQRSNSLVTPQYLPSRLELCQTIDLLKPIRLPKEDEDLP